LLGIRDTISSQAMTSYNVETIVFMILKGNNKVSNSAVLLNILNISSILNYPPFMCSS